MAISFSINLKKDSDHNELIFLETIENLLGEDYRLYKTIDKYCPVDFRLIFKDTLYCYLELKVRENIAPYPNLMIGRSKLKNVKLRFPRTIFCWFCVKTQTLWFIKWRPSLMKSIHNDDTHFIDKTDCETGIDNLVETIKNSWEK